MKAKEIRILNWIQTNDHISWGIETNKGELPFNVVFPVLDQKPLPKQYLWVWVSVLEYMQMEKDLDIHVSDIPDHLQQEIDSDMLILIWDIAED